MNTVKGKICKEKFMHSNQQETSPPSRPAKKKGKGKGELMDAKKIFMRV